MNVMRAAVCEAYGPPETLRIVERTVPTPRPGEVLIKIAYAAVNFPDLLLIENKYQVHIPTPFTPGSEFSGHVAALGEGVTTFVVGDAVFGSGFHGGFASHISIPSSPSLRPVPDGVGLDVAAASWIGHATAYHALRSVADVQPGESVVVLGAAGGVGLAAVQIATLLGARVIAVASSDAKLDRCRAEGAVQTVNYATADVRDALKAIEPGGVDVVIDPVGGPFAERAVRATRWGGRFVTVGFASGEIPRIPLNLVLLKGVIIKGFEIRTFSEFAPDLARRDEAELLGHLSSGRLVPHISSVHPLDDIAVALQEVATRRATGKVLIRP